VRKDSGLFLFITIESERNSMPLLHPFVKESWEDFRLRFLKFPCIPFKRGLNFHERTGLLLLILMPRAHRSGSTSSLTYRLDLGEFYNRFSNARYSSLVKDESVSTRFYVSISYNPWQQVNHAMLSSCSRVHFGIVFLSLK